MKENYRKRDKLRSRCGNKCGDIYKARNPRLIDSALDIRYYPKSSEIERRDSINETAQRLIQKILTGGFINREATEKANHCWSDLAAYVTIDPV